MSRVNRWTSGPWGARLSHIYAPDGEIIAQVHNPGRKASDYPLDANRDLMRAAPDLVEALEEAVKEMICARNNAWRAAKTDPAWNGVADVLGERIDACQAALARAYGEQP